MTCEPLNKQPNLNEKHLLVLVGAFIWPGITLIIWCLFFFFFFLLNTFVQHMSYRQKYAQFTWLSVVLFNSDALTQNMFHCFLLMLGYQGIISMIRATYTILPLPLTHHMYSNIWHVQVPSRWCALYSVPVRSFSTLNILRHHPSNNKRPRYMAGFF